MASLDTIKQGPAFPDVFWSAGDQTFLRRPSRPPRERSDFLEGLVSPQGNLNYNLLMHRRLFLGAGCILVCRPLAELLTDPHSGYREFLEDGSIVPALRENADSFADLARQTIAGGNYMDMSPEELTTYARRLDQVVRSVCHTHDSGNQALMNDLAGEALIQPDYWVGEVKQGFEDGLARELAGSVRGQMRDQGRRDFRPTEFWNFAKVLDARNAPELAQAIRVESIIHSHGTLAINFNLPLVVPAPYAQPAGRIYGTGSPFRLTDDTVEVSANSYSEGEIRERKAAIYQMAAALSAHQIREIRQSAGYRRYIQAMGEADRVEADEASIIETGYRSSSKATKYKYAIEKTAAEIAEHAFVAYREDLNALVGAAIEGRLQRIRFLQRSSACIKAARSAAPVPVGLIAQQLSGTQLLTSLMRAGTAAFVTMIGKFGIHRQLEREETRAQRVQTKLWRKEGVKAEFFGPVDKRRWFYDSPTQENAADHTE